MLEETSAKRTLRQLFVHIRLLWIQQKVCRWRQLTHLRMRSRLSLSFHMCIKIEIRRSVRRYKLL